MKKQFGDGQLNIENQKNSQSDDQMLKAAFGYDDKQLLEIFQRAEQEADISAPIPEDGFERLMKRIEEEESLCSANGVEMDTGQGGEKEGNSRTTKRITKKLFRSLLAAAVMGVLVLAWGINAVGKKSYKYQAFTGGSSTGRLIWDNDDNFVKTDSVDEAYSQIKEVMGKNTLYLTAMPKGMHLQKYKIKRNEICEMVFLYKDKEIRFFQITSDVENSNSITADRDVNDEEVYNPWLNETFVINENILENGDIEFDVEFSLNDCRYCLAGIIDKESFCNIVKGISYLNQY